MSVKIKDNIMEVYNPTNGDVLDCIPMTSLDDLEAALLLAKEEASIYNYSSFYYRKNILTKFRKAIVKHADEFIETICLETGKKSIEGLMEVVISLEHLKESTKYLYEALSRQSRRSGILKTRKVWVEYEARGVAGIISPWNYPLILSISPLVEALLAGNSVVLKPSEHTPLTAQLLKTIWDESTNAQNIFQVVFGSEEVGSRIVSSPLTDIICFTGSTSVGRKIAETCASLFKPSILELGGKDPMIILDDANIDRSVDAAIWGGLSNAGQTCISVERIFVHNKIFEEVVSKLKEKIKLQSCGFSSSAIGAITVESSLEKIQSQIAKVRKFSEIVEGSIAKGSYIAPSLIINPPLDSEVFKEETFGPVITIHPFKTDEEAIHLANDTGYGLSASLFGKNIKRLKFIARRINAGSISINDVLTQYGIADLPFGGKGLSGFGKVHGKEGLRAFSHQKSYMNNRVSFKSELWWYEKSKGVEKILRKLIKWQYS